jgi:hypothetical protein
MKKTYFRIKTERGFRRVRCWHTCSKYFEITPTIGTTDLVGRRFTLTHRRSRYAVAFSNQTKPLRLLAGVLGALPMPWGTIQSIKGLRDPWLAIPKEVRDWFFNYTTGLR